MGIEMPLLQKASQGILLHGGHGAGIKAQLGLILPQQGPGQHHVSDPQRGGQGPGEGVHIDDPVCPVDAAQGGDGAAGEAELAVIVILDEIAPGGLPGPAQQALPPGDGHHRSGGELVVGGQVEDVRPALLRPGRVHPLAVYGEIDTLRPVQGIHPPRFRVARVLHPIDPVTAQQLHQQIIEILCPRPHHDLLRVCGDAPELIDVPGQSLAQGQSSAVGHRRQQPLPLLGDDPAHQPGPHGEGKALRPAAAAGQVQQPPPPWGGLPQLGLLRRGPVRPHLHRTDEIPPLLLRAEIALRQKLGIGVLHRDHRRLQVPGQGPLGRKLLPGGQPPGQDILFDAAVEIIIPGQAPPAL